ncbi:hypothetical protein MGA5115_01952 [Marinomonas gallaica]|uniref:Lipoprotein n=1 Tax=Marinomonas gallaica TaxID=1806667 RepID=A0A1C3JRV8_9GAMM|nr:hypothetical protein [Marinomonas gallaica]SBT17836.1 hypothetical protein MGA5115_01952 [Marinomonas gallaica]SBT20162.1 hypothetical protein MGA5116_00745 [Marinomonas gallaica]
MKKYYLFCTVFIFLAGCSLSQKEKNISVIESNKKHTSNTDTVICDEFQINTKDVEEYFLYAEKLDPQEFHNQSILFSCNYSGRLIRNGKIYNWEIYPAGAGYLFNENITENYQCDSKNCPNSILGITEKNTDYQSKK